MRKRLKILLAIVCLVLAVVAGCSSIERRYLYYPTHENHDNGLSVWKVEGKTIGYSRQVPAPQNVWLMLHGNAGQASDRMYALPSFSGRDSVFILEYPGYGAREGSPSRKSFDAAAIEAYGALRKMFPGTPLCVVGESIGSGPACTLASQSPPPDKIVLVVPFDKLASVAAEHVGSVITSVALKAKWDNVSALSKYTGPVEIFGAEGDTIIPIEHARKLASSVPSAQFHRIPGGHNDWAQESRVTIRNP